MRKIFWAFEEWDFEKSVFQQPDACLKVCQQRNSDIEICTNIVISMKMSALANSPPLFCKKILMIKSAKAKQPQCLQQGLEPWTMRFDDMG